MARRTNLRNIEGLLKRTNDTLNGGQLAVRDEAKVEAKSGFDWGKLVPSKKIAVLGLSSIVAIGGSSIALKYAEPAQAEVLAIKDRALGEKINEKIKGDDSYLHVWSFSSIQEETGVTASGFLELSELYSDSASEAVMSMPYSPEGCPLKTFMGKYDPDHNEADALRLTADMLVHGVSPKNLERYIKLYGTVGRGFRYIHSMVLSYQQNHGEGHDALLDRLETNIEAIGGLDFITRSVKLRYESRTDFIENLSKLEVDTGYLADLSEYVAEDRGDLETLYLLASKEVPIERVAGIARDYSRLQSEGQEGKINLGMAEAYIANVPQWKVLKFQRGIEGGMSVSFAVDLISVGATTSCANDALSNGQEYSGTMRICGKE